MSSGHLTGLPQEQRPPAMIEISFRAGKPLHVVLKKCDSFTSSTSSLPSQSQSLAGARCVVDGFTRLQDGRMAPIEASGRISRGDVLREVNSVTVLDRPWLEQAGILRRALSVGGGGGAGGAAASAGQGLVTLGFERPGQRGGGGWSSAAKRVMSGGGARRRRQQRSPRWMAGRRVAGGRGRARAAVESVRAWTAAGRGHRTRRRAGRGGAEGKVETALCLWMSSEGGKGRGPGRPQRWRRWPLLAVVLRWHSGRLRGRRFSMLRRGWSLGRASSSCGG